MNVTPDWFHNRVVTGLQFLMALGLPGTPAGEVITLTATAWIQALWNAPVAWAETPDSARLERAFTDLAVKADRWPSPRQLLEHLPARPEPPALPAPVYAPTAEQRARLQALKRRRWDVTDGVQP